MSIKLLAQKTAMNLMAEFEKDISQAQLTKQIELLLVEIVSITKIECEESRIVCCQADMDIAHKMAHEVRHKEDIVMANLMGLR
ncbi:hypothetical protein A9Q77_01845 [Marinomonas sp. 42_23_T18]|nr:hypothetical protein A9Q77_01845 [Marinomonas sp. 42_23_T18]